MTHRIRRLTALALFVGLGAYLLATDALQRILAPLWGAFSDFMFYVFA